MLSLKAEELIPLELILNTEDSDKHIVGTLYNLDNGDIIEDNIILTHIADGIYRNKLIKMPSIREIKAVAKVFESDQATPSFNTPQKYEELILKTPESGISNLEGKIDSEGIIEGNFKSESVFEAEVNDVGTIGAKITDEELSAEITSQNNFEGEIHD